MNLTAWYLACTLSFTEYSLPFVWMVGKNKMKNWRAAIRTWEKNNYQSNPQNNGKSSLGTHSVAKDFSKGF